MIIEETREPAVDLFRGAWKRRRLLALAGFAFPLTMAVAAASFLPDLFRSSALVVVEREQLGGGAPAQPAASEIESQLQVFNQENLSRARLQELITSLDLYPALRRRGGTDDAIDRMRKDIAVEIKDVEHGWGKATVAFTISYRGRDPAKVAKVTNALASFYVERSQRMRKRQLSGNVALLKAQLAAIDQQLSVEDRKVSQFKSQHLRELPEQVRVNLSAIDRLNGELALNRDKQRRLMSTTAPEPQALDGAAIQLGRLREELRDLRGRVSDQHPDVIRLKAEISALSAHSAGGAGRLDRPDRLPGEKSGDVQSQLKTLQDEELGLQLAINDTEHKVFSAPQREQELQALVPAFQTTKAMRDALLARLQDAQLAESQESQHSSDPFRVVDPAVPARGPAAPNRMRILLAGLVLAFGFSLGSALLAEKLDTSFHSLEELRGLTRVPVLASIPDIHTPHDAGRRTRRAVLALAVTALGLVLCVEGTWLLAHDNERLVWMLAPHDRS